jgi:hypothetical protein
MAKTKKLPKWHQVIPAGKTGDEEQRFFIALARHPKFEWRSVAALSKETGLTRERVEQIITKYHKMGLVIQNSKADESYAYWERVPDSVPADPSSITTADQTARIKSAMKSESGQDASPAKKK